MTKLSPGQQRIREIVDDIYPLYLERLKNIEDKQERYDLAFQILRPVLINDDLIRQDQVTGRNLEDCGISSNYLRWLNKEARVKWGDVKREDYAPSDIRLDRHYPGHNEGYAYQGGVRYDSTFSCLIGLYERKALHRPEWNFTYYLQDGIIKSGGGGHHRTLAHVLYGESRIKPEYHYIVDTKPDPQLHDSFLIVESFVKKLRKILEARKTDGYPDQRLFFSVDDTNYDEQIKLIRNFQGFYDQDDWPSFEKIFSHDYAFERYVNGETINIFQLVQFINETREVLGHSVWYRRYLIFQDWWNRSPRSTMIEKILLDLPSKND